MFTIEQLLAPVSASHPCGDDIGFSAELDAIAKARLADDPSLEQGAWVSPIKEADWNFVATRCVNLIETRSKDLRLAVWLAEAIAKSGHLRAFGDSLLLIAALCERHWAHLHPLPDEAGCEQRIGNLCWIAARAPKLIHQFALTEGVGTAYSMNDFAAARLRGAADAGVAALDAARRRTPRAFYQTLLADARHCEAALGALERMVDERLGADGPGFTMAKAALQEVIDFVTPCAQDAGAAPSARASASGPERAPAKTTGAVPGAPLQHRDEALAQLRVVAEFFRRTEPHSPVAYLAEKAALWGEQPLHVWLRTVVKDPASYAHLEELLGLQRSAE
jgi:type VI secretion system protein ImpA